MFRSTKYLAQTFGGGAKEKRSILFRIRIIDKEIKISMDLVNG